MKNTFGNSFSVTLFGESHGEMIGCVIDGVTPGLKVDFEKANALLLKRKGLSALSTKRNETDELKIVSGFFNGMTTGSPLCILFPNNDTSSKDYSQFQSIARPSHADYTAYCKYHGYTDYRGGGHFSGRITAPLVAAGSIALQLLESKGIFIGTHIKSSAQIVDRDFDNVIEDIKQLEESDFPMLDSTASQKLQDKIVEARMNLDSIGGMLETVVTGMPAGFGEPWFDTVESVLSHALFSIPAVKGVSFGAGFDFCSMTGSEANDSFRCTDGKITTTTNHNGGINGGITNGQDIVFSCAVKPTPSISREQDSVNFITGENVKLTIHGRHDPAIIHKASIVVTAMTAITLCDIIMGRYGTDYFMC